MRFKILCLTWFASILIFIPSVASSQDSKQQVSLLDSSVSFAGMKGGKITKTDLISADSLVVPPVSTSDFHIIAYKLTVVSPTGIVEFESAGDGRLTEEMKKAIDETHAGCNVFFEYIKSRDSKGTVRSHAPLSYRIVD